GDICFYDPSECGSEAGQIDSFEELLSYLQGRPTNDQLSGELRAGRRGALKSSDVELLDQVVDGYKRLRLRLSGRGGGASAPSGGAVAD
ncbi:MAG TPA: hypothetical protein VM573_09850, partial [Actinomycetota bacterium]|nr:hypothetical protein [Actinomycetota bacterium]